MTRRDEILESRLRDDVAAAFGHDAAADNASLASVRNRSLAESARAYAPDDRSGARRVFARLATALLRPSVGFPTMAVGALLVAGVVALQLGLWNLPDALPTKQFVVQRAMAALADTNRPGTVTYIEYVERSTELYGSGEPGASTVTQKAWRTWDGRLMRREIVIGQSASSTASPAPPATQTYVSVERDGRRATVLRGADGMNDLKIEYGGPPARMLIHLPLDKCDDCHADVLGKQPALAAMSPREQVMRLIKDDKFKVAGRRTIDGVDVVVLRAGFSTQSQEAEWEVTFREDTYDLVTLTEWGLSGYPDHPLRTARVSRPKIIELEDLPKGFFDDPVPVGDHTYRFTAPVSIAAMFDRFPIYWSGDAIALPAKAGGDWRVRNVVKCMLPSASDGWPQLSPSGGDPGCQVFYDRATAEEPDADPIELTTMAPRHGAAFDPTAMTNSWDLSPNDFYITKQTTVAGHRVFLVGMRVAPGVDSMWRLECAYVQMPDATVRIAGADGKTLDAVVGSLRLLNPSGAGKTGDPSTGSSHEEESK